MHRRIIILLLPIGMLTALAAYADGGFLDVEMGAAFTGYNDVRIPSKTGDTISLATDINSDPALVLRVRGGYTFVDRHTRIGRRADCQTAERRYSADERR